MTELPKSKGFRPKGARPRVSNPRADVTVHGRSEVVVVAAEEFRRLKGSVTGTGKALVQLRRVMEASKPDGTSEQIP